MKHYVYIVKCKHGTYYTGSTKDLKNRMKLHDRGRGAKIFERKRAGDAGLLQGV